MCFNGKKSIKQYFSDIASKGIVTNKEFQQKMKLFLTNKGCVDNCDIMLRGKSKIITDNKCLAKPFNEYHITIVERSTGLKPEKVCHSEDLVLHNIIKKYENHSSLFRIKNNMSVKSAI